MNNSEHVEWKIRSS